MTVKRFMEAMENETSAITFIISCMGINDVFTKEEISKLNRMWGLEEVSNYFMLNTREMIINIK